MFTSISTWFDSAAEDGVTLAEAVLHAEVSETGVPAEDIMERIAGAIDVMRRAVEDGGGPAKTGPAN